MRCQRCQFENMPGQTKCFQCGSILESTSTIVDIHPPRMAQWKKPFRSMARWARRWKLLPSETPSRCLLSGIKMDPADSECLWGLFLSIIPGLAHLVHHRFREIRWYFIGWLLALSIGLFLYGTNFGLCFIGLAVGLHAWIAIQHSLLKRLEGFGERLGTVLFALIILALIYWATPRVILPSLRGGYTALTLPYQNIQRRDYLLGWREEIFSHPFPRGSLVLTQLAYLNRRQRVFGEGSIFVQIIGLPGETIQIKGNIYVIDGKPLDQEKYPPPRWLHERQVSIIVPPDCYFVSSEYNAPRNIREGHIRTACLIDFDAIRARAFMRWLPLSRRGFIEETE